MYYNRKKIKKQQTLASKSVVFIWFIGGPSGTRTPDLPVMSRAL
ncbi:protein of unknown function [[Clostridium] ultunense Esp]|uniref:Uncharacterized protein n=1 Tax=[Clostridium] ultunense Esp TaxID=1288971 RepID=A0A1M4PQE9_9FIRM|nr:protein of unknown function [[Clostridium] ultunense Esp]